MGYEKAKEIARKYVTSKQTNLGLKNVLKQLMMDVERIAKIVKLKTSILKSSLWDYSDPHIFVSGTLTIDGQEEDDVAKRLDEREKGVIFKLCAIS